MLRIKRTFGQWIRVIHPATGHVLRIQVDFDVRHRQVTLAFDGPPEEFRIDQGRDGAENEASPVTREALAETINRMHAQREARP